MIGSSILISSPSKTLTYPLSSIDPLAVVSPLTFLWLPLLLLFLAHGRCFRTWIPTTYQFFFLSLSLRSFAPTNNPLSSIFQELAGMALLLTSTLMSHCRGILVCFSFLCCYSLHFYGTKCGQIFHCFRPHQTPS